MPEIKVYVTDEEDEVIRRYAAVDGRPLSNLFRYAVIAQIRRDKKRDSEGEIIRPPGR